MTNKFKFGLSFILFISLLTACFKEDKPIKPVEQIRSTTIRTSIYKVQSFYNLSQDTVVKSNPNEAWDIAFDCSPKGYHICINYASLKGIYHTGINNFNQTSFSPLSNLWVYDASSGNPDSTAIGNWTDYGVNGPEVLLIGTYDGTTYQAYKKLLFTSVNDTAYHFSFANLDNSDQVDQWIQKDTAYNYIYYSLTAGNKVSIEPPKNKWDILFTQYNTTLFESNGTPVFNYPVRGVYLNPFQVSATLDSINDYNGISALDLGSYTFSKIQDYIGYNWKAVSVNQSANTATYAVRKNYTYIIKNTEGQIYKLKFLSFVNDSLIVGYPTFETLRIQ